MCEQLIPWRRRRGGSRAHHPPERQLNGLERTRNESVPPARANSSSITLTLGGNPELEIRFNAPERSRPWPTRRLAAPASRGWGYSQAQLHDLLIGAEFSARRGLFEPAFLRVWLDEKASVTSLQRFPGVRQCGRASQAAPLASGLWLGSQALEKKHVG